MVASVERVIHLRGHETLLGQGPEPWAKLQQWQDENTAPCLGGTPLFLLPLHMI